VAHPGLHARAYSQARTRVALTSLLSLAGALAPVACPDGTSVGADSNARRIPELGRVAFTPRNTPPHAWLCAVAWRCCVRAACLLHTLRRLSVLCLFGCIRSPSRSPRSISTSSTLCQRLLEEASVSMMPGLLSRPARVPCPPRPRVARAPGPSHLPRYRQSVRVLPR